MRHGTVKLLLTLSVFVVILTVTLFFFIINDYYSINGRLDRALDYFESGKYHHALSELNDAQSVTRTPQEKAMILYWKSQIYFSLYEHNKARQTADHLFTLALTPAEKAAYRLKLGTKLYFRKRYTMALEQFKHITLDCGKNAWLTARLRSAMCYRATANYPEAIKNLDLLLGNIGGPGRLRDLAVLEKSGVFFDQKKYPQAAGVIEKAHLSSFCPKMQFLARFRLGMIYEENSHYHKALKLFKSALKYKMPGGAQNYIHYHIGKCYYKLNRYHEAVTAYSLMSDSPHEYTSQIKQAMNINQRLAIYRGNALLNTGIAYCKMQDYDKAKATFKRLIDNPEIGSQHQGCIKNARKELNQIEYASR